ncbi:MAG: hypothetical protein VXY56_05175 [Pseudomonadota bacterium]|nr:hypothetical protein [Pseudomonadota bacterium]
MTMAWHGHACHDIAMGHAMTWPWRVMPCHVMKDMVMSCHGTKLYGLISTSVGEFATALCQAAQTRSRHNTKVLWHDTRNIPVTYLTSVEVISVVTLIRTDTTLDHSQEAEQKYSPGSCSSTSIDQKRQARLALFLFQI